MPAHPCACAGQMFCSPNGECVIPLPMVASLPPSVLRGSASPREVFPVVYATWICSPVGECVIPFASLSPLPPFIFRGFHPRLQILNHYAVLAERFASDLITLRTSRTLREAIKGVSLPPFIFCVLCGLKILLRLTQPRSSGSERFFCVIKIFGGFRRKATNGSGFWQTRGSADWLPATGLQKDLIHVIIKSIIQLSAIQQLFNPLTPTIP